MKIANTVLFSFIFIFSVSAVGIGLESGISSFRYAEIGVNNKDDLCSLNSALIGLSLKQSVDALNISGSFSAQLPYNFTFRDAFGSDDVNYLENLYYYGISSNVSLGYVFLEKSMLEFSLAFLINYDYFYFREIFSEAENEHVFSVLGSGLEVTGFFPLEDSFGLEIDAIYAYNFLPLYSRGISFKWSDNIGVSIGLVYLL